MKFCYDISSRVEPQSFKQRFASPLSSGLQNFLNNRLLITILLDAQKVYVPEVPKATQLHVRGILFTYFILFRGYKIILKKSFQTNVK